MRVPTASERAEEAKKPIDPLWRVFVPIEKRNVEGRWVFSTHDGERYERLTDGSIRHVGHKTNGKVARKRRAKQRAVDHHSSPQRGLGDARTDVDDAR